MKGFTVIEFLLVSGLVIVLLSIGTINLFSAQHKSQLSATIDSFTADMRQQQIRAMSGDAENIITNSDYGMRVSPTQYTLFRGGYGTSNSVVNFPNTIQVSTTAVNSDIIFKKGSGELIASTTVTFKDTVTGSQKVLKINKLGIVTEIN